MICKLCKMNQVEKFCENSVREFYRCSDCELVFVPQKYHLSTFEEKARYDLHDNNADNAGYVNYLNTIVNVATGVVSRDKKIIDFGSGKNAVLTGLLKKKGYDCTAYDPLFDHNVNQKKNLYDVLIACEVVEHLRDLRDELFMIRELVKDRSEIIIRTQLYPQPEGFLKWWYIQDLTHINFFSLKSMDVTCQILNCQFEETDEKDIFILKVNQALFS